MDYTQKEPGDKVGQTAGRIGQIERGVTTPRVEVLTRIVPALSLDANLMFSDREISDERKDSIILPEQVDPERRKFIVEMIRMAYKRTEQEKEGS